MNYFLLPLCIGDLPAEHKNAGWLPDAEISLGGFFYDHILSDDGTLVGVRYWMSPGVAFEQHPVFSQYIADRRCDFNIEGGYVDIVFDEKYANDLHAGLLKIDNVQDFGGEWVVAKAGSLGVAFSL
ncbi:hypothetical protein AVKW3434_18280 [Acidovorax sp. SUPP3434]|uniref:hypothetical protein n=1 Tax=Acidovorax sp. SUPP3434 TaxID=2920880 RepID=UPI0023DE3F08|nr:hypothetical protein [Acidovorax sp. SUPP3434]GKT01367.1 hypothetical protein AVKW3434_18280 [Acidovorax sp. SUPP3434]